MPATSWYHANKARAKAKAAEWRAANKESIAARSALRRKAKAEEIREYGFAYRVANREKIRTRIRSWRDANKDRITETSRRYDVAAQARLDARFLLKCVKARAKEGNREFDLTLDWVEVNEPKGCALSGMPFNRDFKLGAVRPYAPSIDRIDSSKGYTQSNCRIIMTCINIGLKDWGFSAVAPIWRAVLERGGLM